MYFLVLLLRTHLGQTPLTGSSLSFESRPSIGMDIQEVCKKKNANGEGDNENDDDGDGGDSYNLLSTFYIPGTL